MSDELLPNGMRLGQDVQTFTAGGGEGFPWVAGKVIAYCDHPTVTILCPDGTRRSVSERLHWGPYTPPAHPEAEVAALVEEMFDLWGDGDDVTARGYREAATRLLDVLAAVRGGL